MQSRTGQIGQLNLSLGFHHNKANVATFTQWQYLTHIIEILQGYCRGRASNLLDVGLLLDTQRFIHVLVNKRIVSYPMNILQVNGDWLSEKPCVQILRFIAVGIFCHF